MFSEIDEVTESTRQARLSLERQVKIRTQEIKNECVQSGIEEIQIFIGEQTDEFKHKDDDGVKVQIGVVVGGHVSTCNY